jgi:hypothetical protein
MDRDPFKKAEELINAVKYFRGVEAIQLPHGKKCPFSMTDLGEEGHYLFSHAAVGLGYIRWDCPFCGKHYEE